MAVYPKHFDQFKDILEQRRTTNDLFWITRTISFVTTNNVNVFKPAPSPKKMMREIMQNEAFLQWIDDMTGGVEIEKRRMLTTVWNILLTTRYSNWMCVIRWLGLCLVTILKKTLIGLHVNEVKLIKISKNMEMCPVVFLPTHRSYADFILMAFICFNYNIQLPCVAAGMDFHSMWGMGKVLRESKAFFMRRTFSGDPVYRKTFEEYVNKIVSSGDSPLEFFIEGTRSRTCKALKPKFGFLSMVMKSFYSGQVPDICFVPVAISYERLLEESLFAHELLGVPKPKESTAGLLKALTIVKRNYGNIFMDFSEPISLRSYLGNKVDFVSRSKDGELIQIENLAHYVINRQQELQILSCFHIIAIAYFSHVLINRNRGLLFAKLCDEVKWLIPVLTKLSANIYIPEEIEKSVHMSVQAHPNLMRMRDDIVVELIKPNTNYDKSALKGAVLSCNTLHEGVANIMLQLYVNPSLYFIVRPAFLILILEVFNSPNVSRDNILQEYKFVCDIFSHEFVFYKHFVYEEFNASLEKLESLSLVKVGKCDISFNRDKKLCYFFSSMIYPFLIAYKFICLKLLKDKHADFPEKTLISEIQNSIEDNIRNRVICHYYPLSLDLISSAIRAFTDIGALAKINDVAGVSYVVNAAEVGRISETIGKLYSACERFVTDYKTDSDLSNEKAKL